MSEAPETTPKPSPPDVNDPEWQKRAIELYERTITHNPFIPKDKKPHPRQQQFLLASEMKEVFFGGACGGGKTAALLFAALQFVETPGYAALLLRQSFRDLNQPNCLIPLSKEWLYGTGATWHQQDKRWTFPSGATITFGYLDRPDDVYQYKSAEFSLICWDEVTEFQEESYTFMFTRLRKIKALDVPLRMRATSNPGGKHGEWVKQRFITNRKPGVVYIPSRLADNPSLDREAYLESLANLDPITRRQMLEGDWEAYQGGRFLKEWFQKGRYTFDGTSFHLHGAGMEVGTGVKTNQCAFFVTVDLASTVKTSSDYTVFLACALTPWKQLLVLDLSRDKIPVEQIPERLKKFCDKQFERYGQPLVWAGVEANGTQLGVAAQCRLLPGMVPVKYLQPGNMDKLVRATPAIIACEQGHVFVPVHAGWLETFLYELVQFTGDPKKDSQDDIVDTLSYACLNMGFVHYEAPTSQKAAERQGRDPGRLWRREGRMNRLFGNR